MVISEEYSCKSEIEVTNQFEEQLNVCSQWVSLYNWYPIRRLVHDLICSLSGIFSTKAYSWSYMVIWGVIKQDLENQII